MGKVSRKYLVITLASKLQTYHIQQSRVRERGNSRCNVLQILISINTIRSAFKCSVKNSGRTVLARLSISDGSGTEYRSFRFASQRISTAQYAHYENIWKAANR